MQLTKDTDKIFCLIYKEYLNRRKGGMSKSSAKMFDDPEALRSQFLQGILEDDIHEALHELKTNHMTRNFIDGSFELEDEGIIYMENRFKNGLIEITDFIAKFIP